MYYPYIKGDFFQLDLWVLVLDFRLMDRYYLVVPNIKHLLSSVLALTTECVTAYNKRE